MSCVRLSVTLDEENYRLAKSLAREEDISISKAINRLLKRPHSSSKAQKKSRATGLPIVSGKVSGKQQVTSSDVADFLAENP